MLELNDLRAAFAAHLSADPLRFSMDKALAHVCQMAYQRGLEDGAAGKNDDVGTLEDRIHIDLPVARAAKSVKACHRCGGSLKLGIAIAQTATGSPDFPGAEVVTMSPSGPGRIVECLKCEDCGWRVEGGSK